MESRYIFHVLVLLCPVMTLAINQAEIIQESLPDGGMQGKVRIHSFREVLDVTTRHHIRFAVKAGTSPTLLLSQKHISSIDINTHDYLEIFNIGGYGNSKSMIGLGVLLNDTGAIETPNILDAAIFTCFWMSWTDGVIKVGRGVVIGHHVFMEKAYPLNIDINYLAVWNGYGSGGQWRIYEGIYYLQAQMHYMK